MRQSNLLLLNTAAVYLRVLLTLPIGLMCVRLVFGNLGEIDYGIWATLGATTALVSVLTGALANSAQRHLAYELGTGNTENVRLLFKTALTIFAASGLVLFVAGILLAPLVLSILVIPIERQEAAWWVLHISLTHVAISAALTPYRAILTAYQSIAAVASSELLYSLLSLLNAWRLQFTEGDKLPSFVALQLLASLVCGIILMALALWRSRESRVLPGISSTREAMAIGAFAFKSFCASISGVLRLKGAVILVNVLFGPMANAAIALADQAQAYLVQAAHSLNRSISPAISNQAGRNNDKLVIQLMSLGCKLPTLATALLFAPLLIETETVFAIWQNRTIPPGTETHTRWLYGMALFGIATWGQQLFLEARDRITGVTYALMTSVFITLATGWLGCRHLGWHHTSFSVLACLTTGVVSLGIRPWFVARELNESWWSIFRLSVAPSFAAIIPGLALSFLLTTSLPPTPLRLLAALLLNGVAVVASGWMLAFNSEERRLLSDLWSRIVGKLPSISRLAP